MQKRKFDELISHFNRKVSDMGIDQKYKMELLGMISAIGFAHEKELGTNLAEVGTDCISRKAAINEFCHSCDGWNCNPNTCCKTEWIRKLSVIQPKRGKWILKSYRWECDQCGCLIRRENPFKGNKWNYNFCPNCGADMRGEKDG